VRAFLTKSSAAVVFSVTILVGTIGITSASTTSPTPPATSIGFDISWPQCGHTLPQSPGFGIIGATGGSPFTANKCLDNELLWAIGALNDSPAFYANTGDAGPAYAAAWPTKQQTPEVCSGANSVACSYDYGWNAARSAFENAVIAEGDTGSANPTLDARSAPWWLDVETGNAWQTIEYGRTFASETYDRAMLEGEVASFTNIGVKSIGIYSTASQWQVITGNSGSAFSQIPVWIPGFATLTAAEAACSMTSFTGARVAMIQYPSQGFDGDYVCGLLSTPVNTSVAVGASTSFTVQLVTTNNEGPVYYVQTTGSPNLVVSATGAVTTSGALAVGTYTATGTTSDSHGNTGTFSITLQVGVLLQHSPTTAAVKVSGSAKYSDQLSVTGASGAVTYVQTGGTPNLVVNPTGLVTTNGPLAAGTYTATGTESDATGDKGTFTLTLKVGALVQRLPTSATITTDKSSTFSEQLSVGANLGAETFVQTRGTPNLLVSATGLVTTSGTLAVGGYKAAGTVSDATGDVGTFTFTLSVTATPPPPPPPPTATVVKGSAVAGRTVTLAIDGANFFGQPTITSHPGTKVVVIRDTGKILIARVKSAAHSRNGRFTFTITLPDGASCQVLYNQRAR
jgi:major membrane immunogen (membrane-anchored lipoprotein)